MRGAGGITKTLILLPGQTRPMWKAEACDEEKGQSDLQAQLRDARSRAGRQLPASVLETLPGLEQHSDQNQTPCGQPLPRLLPARFSRLISSSLLHNPPRQPSISPVCSTKEQISSLPRGSQCLVFPSTWNAFLREPLPRQALLIAVQGGPYP